MAYAMEALTRLYPNDVGPKTKAWVERVHNRFVLLKCSTSAPLTNLFI